MKTLGKILLGIVLAIGAVIGIAFWATSDLPKAADAFLSKLAVGDYDGALALSTADFRASTDRAALEAFARGNALDKYESASWSSRSIENNVGQLQGTLSLKGGGELPVTLQLVKGEDGWRVQNLKKADAGVATQPTQSAPAAPATAEAPAAPTPAVAVPDAGVQQQLVGDTMSLFAEALNTQDFSALQASGSTRFRQSVSADRLAEAFQSFIDQGADLRGLAEYEPGIDARVDADGLLHLEGSYELESSKVQFGFQYEQDGGKWKLVDLHVKLN